MNPFTARRRARSDVRLEAALRETLTEHARNAPAADVLAERILAAVATEPPAHDVRPPARAARRGPQWRSWATPLVAAMSVALVASLAVAVADLQPDGTTAQRPPLTSVPRHRQPQRAASPGRYSVAVPVPKTGRATATTMAPSRPSVRPRAALAQVRVSDLTFAGTDDGWALASADCLSGSGRCTAMLRTRNGAVWKGMPGASFNVPGAQGCAAPCVRHLRFADDQVGYAFGPSAMFMTTDGGASWQRQPGGALAVETLDGNVIRVVSPHTGCPGPCDVRVETAPIGSTVWTPAALPGAPSTTTGWSGAGVQFARGGSNAYLLITADPAGGAGTATSTLLRSTDDGQTWTSSAEPCPQSGGEVDSYLVTAGGNDRVTVLCGTRMAPQRWFVATSADGGAHFSAQRGTIPAAAADGMLTGDPSTVLVSTGHRLARSTDGGRSWTVLDRPSGPFRFVGFENAHVGRAVAANGRSIWTTRNGGATWTRTAAFH